MIAGVEWAHTQREIVASKRLWEEFKESAVWMDMSGHFIDLKAELVRLISDPDAAATLDKIREYQAGIRICDEILGLPDSFIEDIEIQASTIDQQEEENGRLTV